MQTDVPVPLPYTSRLGQQIQSGQSLHIRGVLNQDAKRVEVNLLKGSGDLATAEAVLHLNIRCDEKKLVMNSLVGGAWGKEERESLPWKAGDKFDIRVRVLEESLEIRCDGKVIHEFKHRIPYGETEFLQVKGDCSIQQIEWGGRFYKLPWETAFPHGHLQEGQRINISGVPKGDRWNLDLIARNGDILFHFNPRLKEKQIVRNAHKGGFWMKEEREGPFPFEKDHVFDLTIINEPFSIQIMVNNERVGTFQHRTENPIGDYIGMRVDGEVDITSIDFA